MARVACERRRSVVTALQARGTPLKPGDLVDNRYKIEAELGRGGMGIVYRAEDVGLTRLVALKLVVPAYVTNEEVLGRFRREARTLAALRHDNVVHVHAFGVHDVSPFYAMEYVHGENLDVIITGHTDRRAFVPLVRAGHLLRLVARAVDAVNARGIVHRDVKPSNVVVEQDTGRPVLVDFGLAATIDSTAGERKIGSGTPGYMAPEQGLGNLVDPALASRADVYAFACSAFELLTGRLPFEAGDLMELLRLHALTLAPAPSTYRSELAPFDAAFERALAKEPADRFATCAAFADALDAARTQDVAPTSLTTLWKESPEKRANADVRTSPALAGASPGASLRVLIVDDDALSRAFAGRAVELALGANVAQTRFAVSGAQAVALAATMPNLIILDFDMPGLNGIDTLSRIRALPGGADTRVLVVSARANEEERWKFSVLGVRDFVKKPAPLEQLVGSITEVAARNFWLHADAE